MRAHPSSVVSRTVAAVRSFWRETWLGRVFVGDWLKGWAGNPSRRRHPPSKPRKGANLWIEGLADRNTMDDPFAILQSAWMGAAGTLLTPGLALLKGWGAGQAADAGVQHEAAWANRAEAAAPPAASPAPPAAWLAAGRQPDARAAGSVGRRFRSLRQRFHRERFWGIDQRRARRRRPGRSGRPGRHHQSEPVDELHAERPRLRTKSGPDRPQRPVPVARPRPEP